MLKTNVLQEHVADESLLWSQSPNPAASFRGHSVLVFVWGILWTSFVIWIFNHQSKNASYSPVIFKYVMITMGVIFTLSSLWDVFRAAFSVYGITGKRLVILRKYPWATEIESFYAQDIEFVKKIRKNDGSGHIIFKTIKVRSGKGYRDKDIGFFGLDDVDSVEKIIIQTFRERLK